MHSTILSRTSFFSINTKYTFQNLTVHCTHILSFQWFSLASREFYWTFATTTAHQTSVNLKRCVLAGPLSCIPGIRAPIQPTTPFVSLRGVRWANRQRRYSSDHPICIISYHWIGSLGNYSVDGIVKESHAWLNKCPPIWVFKGTVQMTR